jgi:hypothetical protein
MHTFWTRNATLAEASRWWQHVQSAPTSRSLTLVSEAAVLSTLGVLAAAMTLLGNLGLSLPGHAILRGTLPFVLGISLVPRRGAGTLMSIAAGLTFVTAHVTGVGMPNAAATAGVLALGPALDVLLSASRGGRILYLRAALAGLIANLLAFGFRFLTASLMAEASGTKNFLAFWPTALLSFALFGAVAGLISGIAWFRALPQAESTA